MFRASACRAASWISPAIFFPQKPSRCRHTPECSVMPDGGGVVCGHASLCALHGCRVSHKPKAGPSSSKGIIARFTATLALHAVEPNPWVRPCPEHWLCSALHLVVKCRVKSQHQTVPRKRSPGSRSGGTGGGAESRQLGPPRSGPVGTCQLPTLSSVASVFLLTPAGDNRGPGV